MTVPLTAAAVCGLPADAREGVVIIMRSIADAAQQAAAGYRDIGMQDYYTGAHDGMRAFALELRKLVADVEAQLEAGSRCDCSMGGHAGNWKACPQHGSDE